MLTLRYGPHPAQRVEVRPGTRPAVALIHGGYWRARHGLDLMDPIAADLQERGHEVWNLEYRRVDDPADPRPEDAGGGWPETHDDVLAGLRHLAGVRGTGLEQVVVVGHSVGGQLALLACGSLGTAGAVALAPVTDLVATAIEGLGEDAARGFLGAMPDERPEAYAAGSPLHQLPLGPPQLLLHGDADQRVPLAHTERYAAAASAAGDPVELRVLPDVDHFEVIDPAAEHWPYVVAWIDAQGRSRERDDSS
jgi:acetyl esterase/lipase